VSALTLPAPDLASDCEPDKILKRIMKDGTIYKNTVK